MEKYREYTVKDNDTIESIALNELGDVNRWRELALLNGLDFPYIVAEKETDILAQRSVYASGSQVFGISVAAGVAITIPKGTLVKLSRIGLRDIGDRAPQYYTTAAGTIAVGNLSVTIPIVCEASGTWGNTLDRTITEFIEDGNGNILLNDSTWVPKPAVDYTYNTQGIFNGRTLNIKTTSETILLPILDINRSTLVSAKTYVDDFGDSDLLMNDDGDFIVDAKTGDLAVATGYVNIAQSIMARLSTRRGELKRYPWYGSNIHVYAGKAGIYVYDLIKSDIIATCKQYDLVKDVVVNNFKVDGDAVYLDADITLVGKPTPLQLRNAAIQLRNV